MKSFSNLFIAGFFQGLIPQPKLLPLIIAQLTSTNTSYLTALTQGCSFWLHN